MTMLFVQHAQNKTGVGAALVNDALFENLLCTTQVCELVVYTHFSFPVGSSIV